MGKEELIKNINTPEELFDFMNKNITYGYLGNNNKVYKENDPNFDKDWIEEYILESVDDILKTKVGNCWDQAEFEREWFEEHNYEYKTIYEQVMVDYNNPYPTHTFLIYKKNDKWYWFENAWESEKGIHEFNSLNDLLSCEYKRYINMLRTYDIKDNEINKIECYEYKTPKTHMSVENYINYVKNGKKTPIL